MSPRPASANLGNLDAALSILPPLPSSVRYWDDYLNRFHIIRHLEESDVWIFDCDGKKSSIRFYGLKKNYRILMKLIAVEMLSRVDTTTVIMNFSGFARIIRYFGQDFILELMVGLEPHEVRKVWSTTIPQNCKYEEARSLKAIMHSICVQSIGPWSPALDDYVSKLP